MGPNSNEVTTCTCCPNLIFPFIFMTTIQKNADDSNVIAQDVTIPLKYMDVVEDNEAVN